MDGLIVPATIALKLLLLATTHIGFPGFERRAARCRHLWVPLTSGVALAYVALYMLPKLNDYALDLASAGESEWRVLQHRVYYFVLAGLLTYYAVQRLEARGRHKAHYLRALAFSLYSALSGYLAVDFPRPGTIAHLLVGLVFALHFLGIDHMLRERDAAFFDRGLRWWLLGALFVGAAVALRTELPALVLIALNGFLAGAMLISIVNEEMPDHQDSRTAPFLLGVGLFALAMVLVRLLPDAPM